MGGVTVTAPIRHRDEERLSHEKARSDGDQLKVENRTIKRRLVQTRSAAKSDLLRGPAEGALGNRSGSLRSEPSSREIDILVWADSEGKLVGELSDQQTKFNIKHQLLRSIETTARLSKLS